MGPVTCQTCLRCKVSKPRSAFGRRASRNLKRTCLECETQVAESRLRECSKCRIVKHTRDFPRHRLDVGKLVCSSCERPARGLRNGGGRKYHQDREYKCKGCERELSPDYFDVWMMRGEKWVVGDCRDCKREAKDAKRFGKDEAEAKLRDDILYDFDLARTMFGMSFEDAVDWILTGYEPHGITEAKLSNWGITETRREVWASDTESD